MVVNGINSSAFFEQSQVSRCHGRMCREWRLSYVPGCCRVNYVIPLCENRYGKQVYWYGNGQAGGRLRASGNLLKEVALQDTPARR
ncbi:hypothetical protein E2C01_093305 [Portunus trituberculatus]|uniref:Uncharacterized protein n=1 Tax=Portunus trituberculatus TaxID=210409 RepID=A0A5B7JY74_PORTR|nr:hypothetical protein [Portunus trituberculatus]